MSLRGYYSDGSKRTPPKPWKSRNVADAHKPKTKKTVGTAASLGRCVKMPPAEKTSRWRVVFLVASRCLSDDILSSWKHFMDVNECHFLRPPASSGQPRDDGDDDPDSYTLQQSSAHASFEDLVQSQIGDHLLSLGETMSSFFELLRTGHDDGDENAPTPEVKAQCDVFAQLLLGCVEFRAFCDIMRDKNKRDYYFQILGMWRKTLK